MPASTIDPAVTRLSNPALITDATAKAQIFDFVPARNFRVAISIEDSSAVNPVLDFSSAIVDWAFTPIDPEDQFDGDDLEFRSEDPDDEDGVDYQTHDGEEWVTQPLDLSDPDSESDDDDDDEEDDRGLNLLGFLDLTFLLSRDTIVQAALLRGSDCISVTITLSDHKGAVANHEFSGFIAEEDVLPLGSHNVHQIGSGSASMTAAVRVSVYDCALWNIL